MSTFEEILAKDGVLVYKIRGVSMEPMLRQDRDLVVIRVPSSRLKKNDVALYKRGKDFVLHRVIDVREGYYLIRGDNTYAFEKVPDSDVIGVLTEFKRKGKLYKTSDKRYTRYVKCWSGIYPLRALAVRSVSIAKAVSRKTGLMAFVKKRLARSDAARSDTSNDTEYHSATRDVIYLLRCALNEQAPDKEQLQCGRADLVWAAAKRHMVTSAVAMALEAGGLKSEESRKEIASALRKGVLFKATLSQVEKKLDEAGIWYMPLKGIVLQHLYPKYGMREMADHDILIDPRRAGEVKDIMEDLGFTTKHFGKSSHDVYHKKPIFNFEIHTELFGEKHEEKLFEYYKDVGDHLIKTDGCRREFTPEDFYIYMIAHEYKHYSGGGTGLRSLADTYVYLSKHDLDMGYVVRESEKLGIGEYEAANRSLALNLFGDGELTDSDQEMLEYILSSGTYGTTMHRIENTMKKNNWNKLDYMLSRFLVPARRSNKRYNEFSEQYPLFYEYKALLPILPFYRTFLAIKQGRFIKEARAIKNADK